MTDLRTLLHKTRMVVGFTLVGTVTAGALFGWAPAMGVISVHEAGAAIGAAVGLAASMRDAL